MNDNLDIFICTHTPMKRYPSNPVYKIVSQKKINFDTNLDVIYCEPEKMGIWGQMPRGLSELFNMYYVRHFVEKKEYIGFCHYRAFPLFWDKIPDVTKMLENNDIVVHRVFLKSVDSTYRSCLDYETYDLYKKIFKNEYPEYGDAIDEYLNQSEFAHRNMFIMRTEDFNKMMDFLFEVLQKYVDRIHCYSDYDLMARAVRVVENKMYPDNMPKFQLNPLVLSRFLAYFAEYTISFYIWKNFRRRTPLRIFMTGERKMDGE